MVQRICEQQVPISSVLSHRRDLIYLELSPHEWRVLEDMIEVLKPFKVATEHLSGEKYPTISALGPLLHEIKHKVEADPNDSTAIRHFKKALRDDMKSRYIHPEVKMLLNKASYLDPRFKTLTHLSSLQQEEIFDVILSEALQFVEGNSQTQMEEEVVICDNSDLESQNGPSAKKKRASALVELLGNKFLTDASTQETTPATHKDILQSEMLRYKTEPPISVDRNPLQWWATHSYVYPNLSIMARKYLCITATSVPSEQLFSTAGNVVSAKRNALLPENVEKLVFLHDNLPSLDLHYRRVHDS